MEQSRPVISVISDICVNPSIKPVCKGSINPAILICKCYVKCMGQFIAIAQLGVRSSHRSIKYDDLGYCSSPEFTYSTHRQCVGNGGLY